MYMRGEKPGGNKNRAVATEVGRKTNGSSEALMFLDNRGLSPILIIICHQPLLFHG